MMLSRITFLTPVEEPVVPHFVNAPRSHHYGVFAVGREPGSNFNASLFRMREACF